MSSSVTSPQASSGPSLCAPPSIVMRMASILALADCVREVEERHLNAALAIWQQSERSLKWIFRSDVDPKAEKLLEALRAAPRGLTKREIYRDVHGGHDDAEIIGERLRTLLAIRTIERVDEPSTGGRPTVRYRIKQWS